MWDLRVALSRGTARSCPRFCPRGDVTAGFRGCHLKSTGEKPQQEVRSECTHFLFLREKDPCCLVGILSSVSSWLPFLLRLGGVCVCVRACVKPRVPTVLESEPSTSDCSAFDAAAGVKVLLSPMLCLWSPPAGPGAGGTGSAVPTSWGLPRAPLRTSHPLPTPAQQEPP